MPQFGKYTLIQPIGSGSMGEVFGALNRQTERAVAVKRIRSGLEVSEEVRARFVREAGICLEMRHPNIIEVIEVGEIDGSPYIEMELLEGIDLKAVIAAREPVRLDKKVEIIAQACEALGYAHSQKQIVHRDVKPANLFFKDREIMKVLDFGIARLPASKLTVTNRGVGTPNYMAPEQILMRQSDGRADLFAAGVVLFELITFEHPFKATLIPQRIAEDEPDQLLDYTTDIPPMLNEVMKKALAHDPRERYQTGEQMAGHLRAVVALLRQKGGAGAAVGAASSSVFAMPVPELGARGVSAAPAPEAPKIFRNTETLDDEAVQICKDLQPALSQRRLPEVRALLARLDAIADQDPRYAGAAQLYRAKLVELSPLDAPQGEPEPAPPKNPTPPPPAPPPPAPPPPPPQPPTGWQPARAWTESTAPINTGMNRGPEPPRPAPPAYIDEIPCPSCGAPNLPQAVFCERCSASMRPPIAPFDSRPAPPEKPSAWWHDVWQRLMEAVRNPSEDLRRKTILYGGGGLMAILLICVAVWLWPPSVQPFVASSVCRGPVPVRESASPSSRVMEIYPRGTEMHLLQEPMSRNDPFVAVQPVVNGHARAKGFAYLQDLGREWQSEDPDMQLHLFRLLGDETSSTDEIRRHLDKLAQFNPPADKPELQTEAALQSAGLFLELARRSQRDDPAHPENWVDYVNKAGDSLARMPATNLEGAELQKEVDRMKADAAAQTASPVGVAPTAAR